MKKLIIIFFIFIITSLNIIFAENKNSEFQLSKSILINTNRIVSASIGEGNGTYTPEVLAFNQIYNSKQPAITFKEIFKKAGSAGKIYSLVGLFFLKNKSFKKYQTIFLKSKLSNIDVQYGCKGHKNQDAKKILKQWLEGIHNNLWYTQILINSTNKIDETNPLLKMIKNIFIKINNNIAVVNLIEIKLLDSKFYKGNKYVITARGICADETFKGKLEDELFGIFLTNSNLSKISKVLNIFPTKRWRDYKVIVDKIEENKFSIIGKGITYRDQKLVESYKWCEEQ